MESIRTPKVYLFIDMFSSLWQYVQYYVAHFAKNVSAFL